MYTEKLSAFETKLVKVIFLETSKYTKTYQI